MFRHLAYSHRWAGLSSLPRVSHFSAAGFGDEPGNERTIPEFPGEEAAGGEEGGGRKEALFMELPLVAPVRPLFLCKPMQ